jgi:drug/metabolite transporter (DMT)-like permease
MKTVGIIVMAVGLLLLLIPGFQWVTQKKVADIGPIEIYRDQNHNIQGSPIAGAILLIGGMVFFAVGKKK